MSDQSRHERLMTLFDRALALTDEERGALLDAQCAEDPAMRLEVLELLAHDTDPQGIAAIFEGGEGIERLAQNMPSARVQGTSDRIGSFRVLRKLGEGGMGIVYEAVQENPQRVVALKLMRATERSALDLHRFEQEARILGQLQHPGIAQVFEAGTVDKGLGGQPYIAMELIDGRDLYSFAQEESIGLRQRVQLVYEICLAVNHVHLRGVIHRDLQQYRARINLTPI